MRPQQQQQQHPLSPLSTDRIQPVHAWRSSDVKKGGAAGEGGEGVEEQGERCWRCVEERVDSSDGERRSPLEMQGGGTVAVGSLSSANAASILRRSRSTSPVRCSAVIIVPMGLAHLAARCDRWLLAWDACFELASMSEAHAASAHACLLKRRADYHRACLLMHSGGHAAHRLYTALDFITAMHSSNYDNTVPASAAIHSLQQHGARPSAIPFASRQMHAHDSADDEQLADESRLEDESEAISEPHPAARGMGAHRQDLDLSLDGTLLSSGEEHAERQLLRQMQAAGHVHAQSARGGPSAGLTGPANPLLASGGAHFSPAEEGSVEEEEGAAWID